MLNYKELKKEFLAKQRELDKAKRVKKSDRIETNLADKRAKQLNKSLYSAKYITQ